MPSWPRPERRRRAVPALVHEPGGLRADLVPDAQGQLRYGQLFSVQPFGNNIMVRTYTGAQIRAVLEQQFAGGTSTPQSPRVLSVSEGLATGIDLSQPAGSRISQMTLHGKPLGTPPSTGGHQQLLASGGDGFTVFMEGETPRAVISIWMCWRPTCWHTAR